MTPSARLLRRGFFGIYLLLYPLPWLSSGTSALAILAFLCAACLFLFLPFLTRCIAAPIPVRVVCYALIGTVLIPFGGYWDVFFISAGATCGAIDNPRTRLVLLALLSASYILLGIVTHESVIGLLIGLIVTAGSLATTRLSMNLHGQNIALAEAKAEIAALTLVAERERFARDLHDTLGHSLTLIAMKSDLALRYTGENSSPVSNELREIGETAREALAETRLVVTGMQARDFAQELAAGARTLRDSGVETIVTGGDEPVPARYDAILRFCLREAITNILRHARATSCAIRLETPAPERIRLTIEDRTHSPENVYIPVSFREGNGISGIRARLTEAGGSLQLSHRPDGTTLAITLGDAS